MIRLFNYLTRKKEIFKPLKDKRVGLYTCGPTVYNYAHIGNLRTYIFEDVLRRALDFDGYAVRQVMNITDVDDKTIRDSKKAGKTLGEFTRFYTGKFLKDIKKLNILPAWRYPRATAHTREMIRLIATLLRKGFAYPAADGVYFDISKFRPYGRLARVRARRLKAGARVSSDEYSKDKVKDFALWKTAKSGEPSWPAPFGRGRPGWHIECSAMSMKYLGATFDIHAGAVDLLFPHHENEIAQSEGATGKPFVRIFVEAEHLLVDNKKMSKSLGNIYTLADIEKKRYEPLDFRYFVLGAQYRTPLNFTWKAVAAAREARRSLLEALERIRRGPFGKNLKDENEALKVIAMAEREFRKAVSDDLNTPKALAVLHKLFHYANTLLDRGLLTRRAAKLVITAALEFDRVLGLNLKKRPRAKIPAEIQKLVQKREKLRQTKKWAAADKIRKQIQKLGYAIEDTPSGPSLKKK